MGIKKHLFLLLLFCCSTISLAVQRDSISIDPRWNYWHVDAIAYNGDWAFVYQGYPNDLNKNKAFAVHTDTKQKVDVTGISQPKFTSNNFLIGKKELETVEVNLASNKQTSLGVLKQQDWIENEQTFSYITAQNELVLKKYSKKDSQIIWSKKGIPRYYLNPSKTRLLYQKDGNTILYQLDLKTFEEKQILDIKEILPYYLEWNFEENAFTTIGQSNDILYINLDKGISKIIKLPKTEIPIVDISASFFLNNDLYISCRIDNAIKDPIKDYLDIWNGNDRDLKYKILEKNEAQPKAFVYTQSNGRLTELPRSKKQEYLNIGIPNYLLVYEPLELQDYSKVYEDRRYRLLDLKSMEELGTLTTTETQHLIYRLYQSPNGNQILYPNGTSWEVYDFKSHKRITIPHTDTFSPPLWTNDSKLVLYHDRNNLLAYNIQTQQTEQITDLKGTNRFRFINTVQKTISSYIDINKPFLFSIQNEENKTTYYSWFKNKLSKIVDQTSNKLNIKYLKNGISTDGKTMVWTEENYNLPQTVKVYRNGKTSTLLEPELPEELYDWRKQKVIHYKDKYGVELTGILWYPKNYNPTKKYPMVTMIYDRLGYLRSEFEIPTLYNQHGFNRALLNDEGYFVFQPDTYVSDEGPGLSAVECVTKGIETIKGIEPAINEIRIGLIGHSFGGFEVSFILGNSKLFAAGVSGAGLHDLINFNYEYNYYRMLPNSFIMEHEQFKMNESFGVNPTKYYNNSPIHFAQNYTTPILLWTGLKDYNSNWENTRHMYIALQRYKKPVIALFYKKENHAFSLNKEQVDLTYRVMDWFDYYLKGKKDIEWISKGIDYNNY